MTIADIIDELGIQRYESRPGWITVDCPWCGKPGKPGLGIPHNTRRIASCWACGLHSLSDVLIELSGRPWQQIKELLGNIEETEATETHIHRKRLILPGAIGSLARSHKDYLRSRGFRAQNLVALWNLQGIGIAARLPWRIFIPIQTGGHTVSWSTRSISDKHKRRYINARPEEEAIPAKTLLYGSDYVRHAAIVCYSDDTDVLTDNGWVRISRLTLDHRIAQYTNPTTKDGVGPIEFVHPNAIQKFRYSGEMINYKSDWCDLLVTPDHRMLVRRQHCFPRIIKANEFRVGMTIPVAGFGSWENSEGPTPVQARLLVAYAADGHWEERGLKVAWNFYKERKIERFRKLLSALKIKAFDRSIPSSPGVRFSVYKNDIPYLDKFGPKKKWPWQSLQWGLSTRIAILNEIPKWDGDGGNGERARFFTSKRRSANVVSALAAITGWGSTIRHTPARKEGRSDEYVVNLNPKSWRGFYAPTQPTIEYEGRVYCCTVPSGFIVVRRNGKVAIAGNCEGPTDVWRIGPGAVATLGTRYTKSQVAKIAQFPVRAVCFDSDPLAQEQARKLCNELSCWPGKTLRIELDADDPGSASKKEVAKLRRILE